MGRQKSQTYGEIADTVLPTVIFTIDTLNKLSQSVDTYVELAPRDRRAFLHSQMESIWHEDIDWTSRTRTAQFSEQWSALQRYFKEQGRICGPPALPESTAGRKWTGVRACGVVFRDTIDEMIFLGTGMRPGDPRGYIGHRMKCRTVLFWKLPQNDRDLLNQLAKEWQTGGPPAEQKMEAYYRRFHSFIRNVHMTALREYGQHLVTIVVPEPGLTNPPRLYEFMHELKILDKPLVKTVPIGDTLRDIYLEVNHAAGRIEGAALPTILNKKSRLKRRTTWSLSEESFVGRDGIVLKADEFDEELFFKEAISMVYLLVRMAHSNISGYRDLDPPWSSFHKLVDSRYLLPDVPMRIPTALLQPHCFRYLKHWFTVTEGLKFNMWQRKNSLPSLPVPLEERWWASSSSGHAQVDLIPPAAQRAMSFTPAPLPPAGVTSGAGIISLFGSAGAGSLHAADANEYDLIEMLDVRAVPDPEDFEPNVGGILCADDEECKPPCLVPANGEARGQWCCLVLRDHCNLPLRATRALRLAIQQAVELPLIPNASYPLKSAGKRSGLPKNLNWDMRTASPPGDIGGWVPFLLSQPWAIEQDGRQLFAGTELLWAYILGWVLYIKGYAAAGGTATGNEGVAAFTVGCAGFTRAFADLCDATEKYADQYGYPGWAPSVKYAVAQSRSHYLAYLLRHEEHDVLLPLLRLVTRMDDGPIETPFHVVGHSPAGGASSWITDPTGVPSWQWQRCGLPPASHRLSDLPSVIFEWLKTPDHLIRGGQAPRSRETGLAVLLKVALLRCDLENIEAGNWTAGGAMGLESSTLRPHVRTMQLAISDWANEQAVRLEPLLPVEGDDQEDGDDNQDEDVIPPESHYSRRLPVSDSRPAHLDERFETMDMERLNAPHTVAEYRDWVMAQPRTAVQELSRRGLQGVSQLEERKKMNRAIRNAAPSPTSQRRIVDSGPVPQRISGGWEPMPAVRTSDLLDDDDDERPRKKRRTLVIKRSHQERSSVGGGVEVAQKAGAKAAPNGGCRRVRPANGTRSRTAVKARRRPALAAVPEETSSSSESDFDFGNIPQFPSPVQSDDELPLRISSFASLAERAVPVTFSADSLSSGMDIDSDDLGSALSIRPAGNRRLAFITPDSRLAVDDHSRSQLMGGDHGQKSSNGGSRPVVRPRPSERTTRLLAQRRAENAGPAGVEQDVSAGISGAIRRSSRLNGSTV